MRGPTPSRCLIPGLLCSLLLLTLLTTGCTSLMRGFRQDQFVSNGYPALTVGSNLPMTLSGRMTPMVLSEMLFITPRTWLAIYGAETPTAPLAIVSYAVAPDLFQWDLASISFPDGPVTSEVAFGGQTFTGALRVISAARDPFASFAGVTPETAGSTRWLVQRYANLADFRKTKIILEYRELLPASLEHMAESVSWLQSNPEVRAFIQRAEAAFSVQFAAPASPIVEAPWIGDSTRINIREMGRFLGSLSPIDPFLTEFNNGL